MHGPGTYTDHQDKSVFIGQMNKGKKEHGMLKKNGDEYHGYFDEN